MERLQKHFGKLKTASIILLFFTGVNAIIAGTLFMIDPTGSKMGVSTSYLSNAPFANFLIPGITLFVVNGLMNVLTAILTLKNYKHFPSLIILQGLLLSGWIIMQVIWVRDFNALHFSMLFIGVSLIILGWILKRVSKHSKDFQLDTIIEKLVENVLSNWTIKEVLTHH